MMTENKKFNDDLWGHRWKPYMPEPDSGGGKYRDLNV
jgi:hypothetical protein